VLHSVGMGIRRRARERAVQFLFQHDINPIDPLTEALSQFFDAQGTLQQAAEAVPVSSGVPANGGVVVSRAPGQESSPPKDPAAEEAAIRVFAEPLILGVLQNQKAIDDEIQKYAHNWDVRRMATVDRNVLRLAVYEMRFRDDIPPVVSINEAVEIAKKFSTQDSGKFVNGILDRIKADLMRPARVGMS
jgi:transcription antitermination factor NusB